MGVQNNVGFKEFPKQGSMLGENVKVCFRYDIENVIGGEVVRYDVEEPFITIIKLADGRYVLSTECMFS